MDDRESPSAETAEAPAPKQARYYGDGGLYRNVKVPVRVVEYVILALIVVLIGCVIFGAATGGYIVTFDARGGSDVPSQKLEYGDLVAEPAPPTREGYVFTGWYRDADGALPWDFATATVADSLTLYAGWTPIP